MAKHNKAKRLQVGWFAYVETDQVDQKGKQHGKKFVKTGYLEYTRDLAETEARKRYPHARIRLQGVRAMVQPL